MLTLLKKLKAINRISFAVLFILFLVSCGGNNDSLAPSPNNQSQAGSFSTMTIFKDHLYVLNNSKTRMNIFDISDVNNVRAVDEYILSEQVETLISGPKYLHLGTFTGMISLDVSNPTKPVEISKYIHVFACDPVVVQEDFAFITIRNGTTCRLGQNELQIVDIRDIKNPKLVNTFTMFGPKGLGFIGNKLFVTDADGSVVHFDISDPTKTVRKLRYDDFLAEDLILKQIGSREVMVTKSTSGIRQYDVTNLENNPALLSEIKFTQLIN